MTVFCICEKCGGESYVRYSHSSNSMAWGFCNECIEAGEITKSDEVLYKDYWFIKTEHNIFTPYEEWGFPKETISVKHNNIQEYGLNCDFAEQNSSIMSINF